MNVIFGSSGFAKEVDFLLNDNNPDYISDYYIGLDDIGQSILNIPIISEEQFEFILKQENIGEIVAFIGIGSPVIRRKVFEKIKSNKKIKFPNAVHHSVIFDKRLNAVSLKAGNIICAGTILTTNINIGEQNQINLDVTIGHDTNIGNFNTFSPGVHISGNVHIGDNVFIGTGAVILEKVNIVDNVIIGAGAIVTKSITEPGTYVGMPAKKIK